MEVASETELEGRLEIGFEAGLETGSEIGFKTGLEIENGALKTDLEIGFGT